MNCWRKWIISLVIVALPASSMAGLQFDVHCQDHTQEMYISVSETKGEHCANAEQTASKHSQRHCECSSDVGCVSAGISLVAIATNNKALLIHNNERIIDYAYNHIYSLALPPLYRPPISIS